MGANGFATGQLVHGQLPLRNARFVGSSVASHSGEFTPQITEFTLPGRGLAVQWARRYRSALAQRLGWYGRGWTASYELKIQRLSDRLLFHDGQGRTFPLFQMSADAVSFPLIGKAEALFKSPDGPYAILASDEKGFALHMRGGQILRFASPEEGGRLLKTQDANGNTISFAYPADGIQITDAFNRLVHVQLQNGRISRVTDPTGRSWHYEYDSRDCLTRVILPRDPQIPEDLAVTYAYDEQFRLIGIDVPKRGPLVKNEYDTEGRVRAQTCGTRKFTLAYNAEGAKGRTEVTENSGLRLVLDHSTDGHVLSETRYLPGPEVNKATGEKTRSGSSPITTAYSYNGFGEMTERTGPGGSIVRRSYDQKNADPRARGNLERMEFIAAEKVTTNVEFTYESHFQRPTSVIVGKGFESHAKYDARGNMTERKLVLGKKQIVHAFVYNPAGQLVRRTDADRVVTTYAYYPENDIFGERERVKGVGDIERPGGLLAKISSGCPQSNTLGVLFEAKYDTAGNIVTRWDGAGNATLYQVSPSGLTTGVSLPNGQGISVVLDALGNPSKITLTFDRYEVDRATGKIARKTSTVTKTFEYESIPAPAPGSPAYDASFMQGFDPGFPVPETVKRVTYTDDSGQQISYRYEHDDQNHARLITKPKGNVIKYVGIKNVPWEIHVAYGNRREEAVTRFTYSEPAPTTTITEITDPNGNSRKYCFKPRGRFFCLTQAVEPDGTELKQKFYKQGVLMGTLQSRVVKGDPGQVDENGNLISDQNRPPAQQDAFGNRTAPGLVTLFQQELNWPSGEGQFPLQVLTSWIDVITGAPMGTSMATGLAGKIAAGMNFDASTGTFTFEFEGGNTITVSTCGGQVITVQDAIGDALKASYDSSGNLTAVTTQWAAEAAQSQPTQQSLIQTFSDLGLPDSISVSSLRGAVATEYNVLGQLISYTPASDSNPSRPGGTVYRLHDSFGRPAGSVTVARIDREIPRLPKERMQVIANTLERDPNNNIKTRTNAAGHATKYEFNDRDELIAVTYADGTSTRLVRDRVGNVLYVGEATGNAIEQTFDLRNRLIHRTYPAALAPAAGATPATASESYRYSGGNHLVSAVARPDSASARPGSVVLRRFDTAGNLLEERQNGRSVKFTYDAAGNLTQIVYPSGRIIQQSFDAVGRLTEIRDVTDPRARRHKGDAGLIAKYTYHAGAQPHTVRLGNGLVGSFSYDSSTDRLTGLSYAPASGAPLMGTRYLLDTNGKRISEAQWHTGKGERYFYDSANRLVGVQYGVEKVKDGVEKVKVPESRFEREVQYALTPAGTWHEVITLDSRRRVQSRIKGTTNKREQYVSLGNRQFKYDANGNRIHETGLSGEITEKRYSYDGLDRLVSVTCLDSSGAIVRTVDYSYDALNRPITRRTFQTSNLTTGHFQPITGGGNLSGQKQGDKEGVLRRSRGTTVETTQYWLGNRLLEEWENGKVMRSYVYGAPASDPVQMLRYKSDGTLSPYYYLYNGRGLVAALGDANGVIAERYGFDIYGTPSVTEIFGQAATTPVSISPLGNPLFGRGQFWDGNAGMFTSPAAPTSMPSPSWSSVVNNLLASNGVTDPTTGQRLGFGNSSWDAVPGSTAPSRLNPGGNPNWDNPGAFSYGGFSVENVNWDNPAASFAFGGFSMGNPNWDNPAQYNSGSLSLSGVQNMLGQQSGVPGAPTSQGISPDSIAGQMGFAEDKPGDFWIQSAKLYAVTVTWPLVKEAIKKGAVAGFWDQGAELADEAAVAEDGLDPVADAAAGDLTAASEKRTADADSAVKEAAGSALKALGFYMAGKYENYEASKQAPGDSHSKNKDSGWGDDGGPNFSDASGPIDLSRLVGTAIGGGDPAGGDINFGAGSQGTPIEFPVLFFLPDPDPIKMPGANKNQVQHPVPGALNNGVTDPFGPDEPVFSGSSPHPLGTGSGIGPTT